MNRAVSGQEVLYERKYEEEKSAPVEEKPTQEGPCSAKCLQTKVNKSVKKSKDKILTQSKSVKGSVKSGAYVGKSKTAGKKKNRKRTSKQPVNFSSQPSISQQFKRVELSKQGTKSNLFRSSTFENLSDRSIEDLSVRHPSPSRFNCNSSGSASVSESDDEVFTFKVPVRKSTNTLNVCAGVDATSSNCDLRGSVNAFIALHKKISVSESSSSGSYISSETGEQFPVENKIIDMATSAMNEDPTNDPEWKQMLLNIQKSLKSITDGKEAEAKEREEVHTKLDNVTSDMGSLQNTIKGYQVQVSELRNVIIRQDLVIQECKREIEQLQANAMKLQLVIHGIERVENENCRETVQSFFNNQLKIRRDTDIKIQNAFRMGKRINAPHPDFAVRVRE